MLAPGSVPSASDEQMQFLQQRAQDMILQLKEEEKWDLYCRKKSHPISDEHETKLEKFQPHHSKPSKLGHGTSWISSRSMPAQAFNSGKGTTVVTSEMQKTTGENKTVAKELKFIKAKLAHLQSGLAELRSGKNAHRNVWDSYYEDLFTNNKYNQSVNRIVLLRKSLENTLSLINRSKKTGGTSNDPHGNETTKPKTIGFQIPYVLKEQRAISHRSSHRSWSSVTAKKNVPKTPPRPIYQPQVFPKRSDFSINRERSVKKHNVNFRNNRLPSSTTKGIVQDGKIDHIAQEITEDMFNETVPVAEGVQKLKEKYVSERISSLMKQLEEMEKVQNDVRGKWHNRQPESSAKLITDTDANSIDQKEKEEDESSSSEEMFVSAISEDNLHLHEKQKNVPLNKERRTLCLNTDALKRIHEYKDKFHLFVSEQYAGINQEIIDQVAEALYDECVGDIATELNNIPHSIVLDLYNREFVT